MRSLLVILFAAGTVFPAAAQQRKGPNPAADHFDDAHRFVFFAVLEGCYRDGLTSEEVDLIAPRRDGGDREMTINFIYSCPLCHPSFEAVRLYGSRLPFHGQKTTDYDTFGEGLPANLKEQLRGDPTERRKAIQELLGRWISKRADLLRLTPAERKVLQLAIAEKKKKGNAALESFLERGQDDYYGAKYAGWKKCPICEGAAGGMAAE